MTMYVSLDDVKRHLRVDFDEDDRYIEGLILTAQYSVESNIGYTLENLVTSSSLQPGETGSFFHSGSAIVPFEIQHAIKLLVGNFYENREPVIIGTIVAQLPYGLDYLLAPYKNWTAV